MKKLSVNSMPELVYVVLTRDCVGEWWVIWQKFSMLWKNTTSKLKLKEN
jgi:hypothetical protein